MKSPCIAACKNNDGICSGCHRTMSEILNWSKMSDTERESIMDKLSSKNATHDCPECNAQTHCDIAAGKETCWCFSIEKRELDDQHKNCLCRKCLGNKELASVVF